MSNAFEFLCYLLLAIFVSGAVSATMLSIIKKLMNPYVQFAFSDLIYISSIFNHEFYLPEKGKYRMFMELMAVLTANSFIYSISLWVMIIYRGLNLDQALLYFKQHYPPAVAVTTLLFIAGIYFVSYYSKGKIEKEEWFDRV